MSGDKQLILVFGIGKLGGAVVDVLAGRFPQHKYVFVARSAERASLRTNLTRYVCAQWGQYPEVTFAEVNLTDVEATAELIGKYRPDIVFNATTPFPWWAMDAFPPDIRALTYSAGLGMWCALDCLLPMKLSQALATVGGESVYVNACYPDMVNPFLSEMPAPPVMGIGNMSNLIPGLKLAFSELLMVDPQELTIRLVAHHFTSLNAPSLGGCGGAPYYLSVAYPGGQLCYTELDDTPFTELKARSSRVRGLEGQGVTVSSAATVLATLLERARGHHHVPGPNGLVGGYPVTVTENREVQLDLPAGVSADRARAINEAAQRFDGLEEVSPGAVSLTEVTRRALNTIIGLELPRVTLSNVEAVASEVLGRLNKRYGFDLSL